MKIYEEGYKSYDMNLTPSDNPYQDEIRKKQWLAGWESAFDDHLTARTNGMQDNNIDFGFRIIFLAMVILLFVGVFFSA